MKKKKKIDFIKVEDDLRNNIIKHNDTIGGLPEKKTNFRQFDSHSWITTRYKPIGNKTLNTRLLPPPVEDLIKCKKIVIKFTDAQKKMILIWMDTAIKMYNSVVKLFKDYKHQGLALTGQRVNAKFIKKITLNNEKNALSQRFGVPAHVLDQAIKRACSMLKTCQTNFARGHQRTYRLNYIKQTVETKIIVIEGQYFSTIKNSFYVTYLGNTIDSKDFNLHEVDADCTLHYDVIKNVFTLLVPIKFHSDVIAQIDLPTLVIDAGVRTFLTGISDNHILEIGNNVKETLRPLFLKIDAINNSNMPNKAKKKKRNRIYKRIKNLVTDLHWKSINHLVKTYGTIVIGEWRTQSCCSKKNKTIDAMTKRIMSQLSFYKFLKKLEYKCSQYRVFLHVIPEHFTSQLCSRCGTKNNVGGSKQYDCGNCGLKIDRDVNSCRSLYMSWLN